MLVARNVGVNLACGNEFLLNGGGCVESVLTFLGVPLVEDVAEQSAHGGGVAIAAERIGYRVNGLLSPLKVVADHLVVIVVVLPESGEVVASAYGVETFKGAVIQPARSGLNGELAVGVVSLAYLLELEQPCAQLGSKPGCAGVVYSVQ